MTLNSNTIWEHIYAALATNGATKVEDPNTTRNDPEKFIFSSFPDYSKQQYYPMCILKEPKLTETAYAVNSRTRVVEGTCSVDIFAKSSADLKNAINVIKAGIRGAIGYLDSKGVTIPQEDRFEDDEPDAWLEEGKKIHFQAFKVKVKSTGTS